MQFSCPECGAAYSLPDKHRLSIHGGKLECYVCHHVFEVEGKPKPSPPKKKASKSKKKGAAGKGKQKRAKQSSSRPVDTVVTGIQPEPVVPDAAKPPESADTAEERPAPPDRPSTGYPAEAQMVSRRPRPRRKPANWGLIWPIGVLILTLGLVPNALWQLRTHPPVHEALTELCVKIGCRIPLLRNPDAIEISERLFTRVPERPDILVMRMRFANTAPFPQPYPGVELVLYDNIQAVIGRGRIMAGDYLHAEVTDRIEPGELVEIELNMLDPEQLAEGFEIAFF